MKSLDDVDWRTLLQLEADPSDHALDGFLEFVRGRYNLTRIAYISPSARGPRIKDPFLALAYSDAFLEHLRHKDETGDEAPSGGICTLIDAADREMEPSLDWSFLPRLKTEMERLLGAAGAGRQGLVIPVSGSANKLAALFIVTADEREAAWLARRHDVVRDMTRVAHYVHRRACELRVGETTVGLDAIGDREAAALKLFAEGNRAGTIADAMGVSADTVKAHLDSVRYKLGALTGVHAVAKAYRAGLLG
jgi:LuxR family quorum-sensing system transcriptional regulator SinR